MEIFPESDNEFFTPGEDEEQITFVKDNSGKAVKLIHAYDDIEIDAPREEDSANR